MKKRFLTITLFFVLSSIYGQNVYNDLNIKHLNESQPEDMDQLATSDGSVLISHNVDHYLNNFSNPDYHLRMQLNPS